MAMHRSAVRVSPIRPAPKNLDVIDVPAPEQPSPRARNPYNRQLGTLERMIMSFRTLLGEYKGLPLEDHLRREIEQLESWLKAYRHGLEAAEKIKVNGAAWMIKHRQRLHLPVELTSAQTQMETLETVDPSTPQDMAPPAHQIIEPKPEPQ